MREKRDFFEQKKRFFEKKEAYLRENFLLKRLKTLPKMVGITKKTGRFLRIKSIFYLLRHDEKKLFRRYVLKKPFKYLYRLCKSYTKPPLQEGDFFLCNTTSVANFAKKLQNLDHIFVLGFSYCHKPFECPSGRFNSRCAFQKDHPVCGQCFIGKCRFVTKNAHFLLIPTVHYIGEKMFEFVEQNPEKTILFLITACELSLRMFHDWGIMLGIEGLGACLGGRICNTMDAFILSEKGIKPGLTIVSNEEQILHLLKMRSTCEKASDSPLDQTNAHDHLRNFCYKDPCCNKHNSYSK